MDHYIYTLERQNPADPRWKPDDNTIAVCTYSKNRASYDIKIRQDFPSDALAPYAHMAKTPTGGVILAERYILRKDEDPKNAPLATIDIHPSTSLDTPWKADSNLAPWLSREERNGVILTLSLIAGHLKEIERRESK
ncbi:hypothetical protein [Bifidobacterium callitrichidarum]|uniref:Uncharacterized protein n=1 Tax=Bifidobacterium callitrichidarum TaxID=2052941 RepID=A0A2U2MZ99_9BIFI|nr:hypothetical protein [Bifidobacterium callitrichidarum]PWG62069.1 hypothetical protein DF196_12645 [Bifidobacterium callitrichidarum]